MPAHDLKSQLRADLMGKIVAAQDQAIRVAMSSCASDRLMKWSARFAERLGQDAEKLRRL